MKFSRKVDVFGDAYLKVHENPEEYLDSSPGDVERLVDVAQSAFSKDGVPTREDVVEHILPVSTLVTAEIDDDPVGFSSTEEMGEELVYAVGLAVEEDYQGRGIGKVMRSLGVKEEAEDGGYVATRTQNPAVLSYMIDLFDSYPRPGEDTPPRVEETLEFLAGELDPEAEFEAPVMRQAYDGAMYDEIPEHELKDFVDDLLGGEDRCREGDALLIAGELSEEEMEEAYLQARREADGQFYIS